mmetsp:Transcript_18973/g.20432  ORF Transcript_18973/g.20432 Transcript_18973/m.20432 type:complete len:88 (-) Transcript_18973:489-752(-)
MTTSSLTNDQSEDNVDTVLDVVVLTESNHLPTTSRMTTTSNNNKNEKKNQAVIISTIVIGFVGVVSAAILWMWCSTIGSSCYNYNLE